jgi:LysM repeat protein
MASSEVEIPDAPACPFLGIAADRRSHFTFPHPAHRCYVKGHASSTDARRQTNFCLTNGYASCDRYRSWQAKGGTAATAVPDGQVSEARLAAVVAPPTVAEAPAPAPFAQLTTSVADVPGAGSEPPGTVIHVTRAGDSMSSIATKYGLTVDELSTANQLPADASFADGTRLVIPIAAPAATRRRSKTGRTAATGK